jgi:hypothetical protein
MGGDRRDSPEGRGLICLYSTPRSDVFSRGTLVFYLSLLHSLVRGARTPRPAHSALPRAEDFLSGGRPTEGRLQVYPFVFPRPHIPWGCMALSRELNK